MEQKPVTGPAPIAPPEKALIAESETISAQPDGDKQVEQFIFFNDEWNQPTKKSQQHATAKI